MLDAAIQLLAVRLEGEETLKIPLCLSAHHANDHGRMQVRFLRFSL